MIIRDTIRSCTIFLLAICIFLRLCTPDKVAQLVVLLHSLPELAIFKRFSSLWCLQIVLFRNTTCKIYHTFNHLTTVKNLEVSMEFSIGLLNEWHPEFLRICTVTVERRFILSTWNACVYNDKLPLSILKELEHGKSFLDSIVIDQIFEKFRVRCEAKEGTEEPTISQNSLFYITWPQSIFHHHWFILCEYLLRAKPLHVRALVSIIRWVERVNIECCVISREFWIRPRLLARVLKYFVNLIDHVPNFVLWRLLLLFIFHIISVTLKILFFITIIVTKVLIWHLMLVVISLFLLDGNAFILLNSFTFSYFLMLLT